MPITAYLVMTNVPPQKWLGPLLERKQIVGRGEEADLRIPPDFAHVSRRHIEVWADPNGHWIQDLDSTSGTRLNGVPLAPHQSFRLTLGDHVWLGAAEFDIVSNPDLAHRRPLPQSDDETIGLGSASGISQQFAGATSNQFGTLSQAELDIVLWMSRGLTDPEEIAARLFRSPHTIRTHLQAIFSKLGVHSRDQLLSCLLRRISAPAD